MGVWSEKVVPIIHKFFWKDDSNKTAAEQACKSFDESKDGINKEVEEKKGVMKPKVIEIYEASSTEIKSLIKEPKEFDLRKHTEKVKNFLDKLVKIDFPGSKAACEVTTKYGLILAPGPALFIFEKVSIFIVIEEEAKAPPPPQPQATAAKVTTREPPTAAATTTTVNKEVATKEVITSPPTQPQATAAKVTTMPPPAAATIVNKEVAIKEDKALPPPQITTTKEPSVAATTITTVNKEVDTKEAKTLPTPTPQATAAKVTTKEPPAAATTTTVNKEVVVEKAVVKEPLKASNAPAVTGKEPPKVDVKKEEPLKKA